MTQCEHCRGSRKCSCDICLVKAGVAPGAGSRTVDCCYCIAQGKCPHCKGKKNCSCEKCVGSYWGPRTKEKDFSPPKGKAVPCHSCGGRG